jgi:hypothetical protein
MQTWPYAQPSIYYNKPDPFALTKAYIGLSPAIDVINYNRLQDSSWSLSTMN